MSGDPARLRPEPGRVIPDSAFNQHDFATSHPATTSDRLSQRPSPPVLVYSSNNRPAIALGRGTGQGRHGDSHGGQPIRLGLEKHHDQYPPGFDRPLHCPLQLSLRLFRPEPPARFGQLVRIAVSHPATGKGHFAPARRIRPPRRCTQLVGTRCCQLRASFATAAISCDFCPAPSIARSQQKASHLLPQRIQRETQVEQRRQ